MTWESFFQNLPAYLLSIGSFIATYIIIKKGTSEVKSVDADIARKYQEMLKIEQDNAAETQREFISMREKIKKLETTLEEVQEILEEYVAGVELLLTQLKASGITPIWKPTKKPTTKKE